MTGCSGICNGAQCDMSVEHRLRFSQRAGYDGTKEKGQSDFLRILNYLQPKTTHYIIYILTFLSATPFAEMWGENTCPEQPLH